MSTSEAASRRVAAFFDVDGTLVRTTIVHYYMYFRRRRMAPLLGALWQAAFFVKCGYYLLLDKIDRSRLNVVFYRRYRDLPVNGIKTLASDCYREVIEPRCFGEGIRCVAEHRRAGREVVLVTGSVDFIIEPLAQSLQASSMHAAGLVEVDGRFTGELDGPPIGDEEKARRVRQFAEAEGIDLSQSYAYGDSIADLPMLEAVGRPHVVNPDKALAATAAARGWPAHRWAVGPSKEGDDQ